MDTVSIERYIHLFCRYVDVKQVILSASTYSTSGDYSIKTSKVVLRRQKIQTIKNIKKNFEIVDLLQSQIFKNINFKNINTDSITEHRTTEYRFTVTVGSTVSTILKKGKTCKTDFSYTTLLLVRFMFICSTIGTKVQFTFICDVLLLALCFTVDFIF